MKNLTHCVLALVPLLSFAGLAASSVSQQEPPKPQVGKIEKTPIQKGRGEKQAALKKFVPTSKTSLAEGIALAEKETTGKAFSAAFEINKDGKALIQVNLFVADKVSVASVDPETKKVSIAPRKEKPAGAPEGAGGDDEEGG